MDPAIEQKISFSKLYLLRSRLTDSPYLDEKGGCFLFESKHDAEKMKEEHEDTTVDDGKNYINSEFNTGFYSQGASLIHVIRRDKKESFDAEIDPADCKKQFYNHEVTFALNRLVQTKEKRYLRMLHDKEFFIPTMIEARVKKQYPKVRFCYATASENKELYILFSTIQEFEEWNKGQKDKYKPLSINFTMLSHIKKNMSVVIDPLSISLILSGSYIAASFIEKTKK